MANSKAKYALKDTPNLPQLLRSKESLTSSERLALADIIERRDKEIIYLNQLPAKQIKVHGNRIQRLHDKYKREIDQHKKTIQQLRRKAAPLGQLPNFDAEKDATIIDLTRKYGDLVQTAEEAQKKFDKVESTFKTQLAERDHEIADLHDQLQNFENDGKRFKEEFSRLKMVSVKAENNIQKLTVELESKRTELDTVTKCKNEKLEQLQELQVEVVELQAKFDEEKQKNASEYQKLIMAKKWKKKLNKQFFKVFKSIMLQLSWKMILIK